MKAALNILFNITFNEIQWTLAPFSILSVDVRIVTDVSIPTFATSKFGVAILENQFFNKFKSSRVESGRSNHIAIKAR